MTEQNCTLRGDYSTARLTQRYRFADPNMDLFFLGALGWGRRAGFRWAKPFILRRTLRTVTLTLDTGLRAAG